jgi:ADP-ribose pyrophosphatase
MGQREGVFETPLSSRMVYQGRILNVRVDEVELPQGRRTTREVVEHRGAAAVVAVDEHDCVLLIRQYRHAVGRVLLELPAGTLEVGEAPKVCAARELQEETGYQAACLEPLIAMYPSPGYASEVVYIFAASDLQAGVAQPEGDESLELVRMPLSEAISTILQGELDIYNGIAVTGLLTAHLRGVFSHTDR